MACCRLIWLFGYGVQLALVVSYLGLQKKHPNPKSGHDYAPDKLGCVTSSRGGVTNPKFLCIFLHYGPRSPTFLTEPGVTELIVGLALVEHPITNELFYNKYL